MAKVLKEYYGYVQALDGIKAVVNTSKDETVSLTCHNRIEEWDLYCKFVKITVEEISGDEVVKHFEEEHPSNIGNIPEFNSSA